LTQTTALFRPQPRGAPETPPDAWHPDAPRQTRFQESLHEPHWKARASIIAALLDNPSPKLHRKAARLCSCGTGASFFVDTDSGHVKPWLSRCRDRLCLFCSNARTQSVTEQLQGLMLNNGCDRMIILTVQTTFSPLAEEIDFLMKSFKRLRRSKTWRRFVDGGAYVLEITLNPHTLAWHPHLHIAYKGKYFPQKLLSMTWKGITQGSYVVWVSKIDEVAGAAREMAKYVGKPQRVEKYPPAQICEYAKAVHGLRMVQCFGSCYKLSVRNKDVHPDLPDKTDRVKLSDLLHHTRAGHESAGHLLVLVAERWPVFGRYIQHEIPRLAPHQARTDQHEALLRLLRAEGPEQARPPPQAVDVEQLDDRIRMAFFAYMADRERGVFAEVPDYYSTQTEHLGRTM